MMSSLATVASLSLFPEKAPSRAPHQCVCWAIISAATPRLLWRSYKRCDWVRPARHGCVRRQMLQPGASRRMRWQKGCPKPLFVAASKCSERPLAQLAPSWWLTAPTRPPLRAPWRPRCASADTETLEVADWRLFSPWRLTKMRSACVSRCLRCAPWRASSRALAWPAPARAPRRRNGLLRRGGGKLPAVPTGERSVRFSRALRRRWRVLCARRGHMAPCAWRARCTRRGRRGDLPDWPAAARCGGANEPKALECAMVRKTPLECAMDSARDFSNRSIGRSPGLRLLLEKNARHIQHRVVCQHASQHPPVKQLLAGSHARLIMRSHQKQDVIRLQLPSEQGD